MDRIYGCFCCSCWCLFCVCGNVLVDLVLWCVCVFGCYCWLDRLGLLLVGFVCFWC